MTRAGQYSCTSMKTCTSGCGPASRMRRPILIAWAGASGPLTRHVLDGHARFDVGALTFDLKRSPRADIAQGRYHLMSKAPAPTGDGDSEQLSGFLYRLSHPLGEYAIEQAKAVATNAAEIELDVTHHPARVLVVEELRGRKGWLTLARLKRGVVRA